MNKNQTTLMTTSKSGKYLKLGVIAMLLMAFVMFAMMPSVATAFANANTNVTTNALDNVMGTVIEIIRTAALYIGIVIVLWGVFQIILAFRREDSEGISKQITTVVVGGVLIGFGATAGALYNSLKNSV